MKNDFIKTQSLKLREKLSAEFKRRATLLGLHKAVKHHRNEERKEKKKSHSIAKVPHHYANAILFHFISVSFSTLAICAVAHVGASKGGSARPHANTPIWGSNSPTWSSHAGGELRRAVGSEMWSNVTADLCKTPSELWGRKPVHFPLPVGPYTWRVSACLKEYKSNLTQVGPNISALETNSSDNRV